MICLSCKRGWHMCRGGTWCDCQHRDGNVPRELEFWVARRNEAQQQEEVTDEEDR